MNILRVDDIHSNEPPAHWTPEHVLKRMIHAFATLRLIPERGKPQGFKTSWHFVFDEIRTTSIEAQIAIINDKREADRRREHTPSALDLSLMDEALAWGFLYLKGNPLCADAIHIYGYFKATGREVEPFLNARHKKAARIVAASNKHLSETKKNIAKEVAAWANERLSSAAGDDGRIKAIKANAFIRFEREVRKQCGGLRDISPQKASPAHVVSRERYTHYRKRAAKIICEQLKKAKTPVR